MSLLCRQTSTYFSKLRSKLGKSGTCIDGYVLTKEHSHKARNLSRLHGSSFREASISAVV